MNCWICNNSAGSREHIIKQSDIRRLFSRGPYKKGERLKKIEQNAKNKIIQSEDSSHIKYQKSLCMYCNSTRSQPWDQAYDKFMEYILSHEEELKEYRAIDLKKTATIERGTYSKNLYSYFIKAFGCQLIEKGQEVPQELSDFLIENSNKTNLNITFASYEGMDQNAASPIIQVHSLEGDVDNITMTPLNYTWAVSIEWITIIFWYNELPSKALGTPFTGTTDIIKIGSYKDIESS